MFRRAASTTSPILILFFFCTLSACSNFVNGESLEDPVETQQPAPPLEIMSTDIQTIIGQGDDFESFANWYHIFGNQIDYSDIGKESTYYFDSGVIVGVSEVTRVIVRIFVDFHQINSPYAFHFSGIDGTSLYDDVIEWFGQPYRISYDVDMNEAVKSYGYSILDESQFVTFFFDDNDTVIAISLHRPLYRPLP